jgi:flagellar motor switch/type III secretory pathway protein FliN
LADLLDRLCRAAMPACVNPPSDTSSEPPGASWARGAGGVSVQLKLGKSGCRLLLDDSCVRAFALRMPAVAAPPAPLAPVDLAQVVDKVPVALRLSIGGARVGVGALMRLAEGDVIRLDTPIDAPVGLLAPSGVAVCNGYLGRVGDRIAVEVLAPV